MQLSPWSTMLKPGKWQQACHWLTAASHAGGEVHGLKVPAAAPEAETEAAPTAAEAVPTATPKAEDASGLHSGMHEAKPPAQEHVYEGESTTGMKLTTFVGRGRAHNVGQDALPHGLLRHSPRPHVLQAAEPLSCASSLAALPHLGHEFRMPCDFC